MPMTRTIACSRSKAILGLRNSGMKVGSGKPQIPSGMSFSGNQTQKFGRLRQTARSLRCSERSTSILHLRTRENYLLRALQGPGVDQVRQPHLWNLPNAFRCTKWVTSSLGLVRTFPTSAEPSFRQWTSLATNARWKDMSQKYTNHLHLRVKSASATTIHIRGIWCFMVVMEFHLCIETKTVQVLFETCRKIGEWHQDMHQQILLHLRREMPGMLKSSMARKEEQKSDCTS